MRDRRIVRTLALAFALGLGPGVWACENAGHDRVLGVDATGLVDGLVFFDRNGDRESDEGDAPLAGVAVSLVVENTADTIAQAASDAEGQFRFRRVPIGLYEVVVDESTLGDSAEFVGIGANPLDVGRADTARVTVTVSFPIVTVAEARDLDIGAKVFVEGIALNTRAAFGDTTVHLADNTAAIRGTRVRRADVFAGDSVRFLGVRQGRAGQPTLDDAEVFLLRVGSDPDPERTMTGIAALADGGRLDAGLVQVLGATIADSATVDGDLRLTVNDGTGALEVRLDASAPIADRERFGPGVTIDATGLLVPTGTGLWRLKPRRELDLTIVP